MSGSDPPNRVEENKRPSSLVDGKDFLQHLREADGLERSPDEAVESTNQNNPIQDLNKVSNAFQKDAVLDGAKNDFNIKAPEQEAEKLATGAQWHGASLKQTLDNSLPKPQHDHSRSISWGKNQTGYYDDDDISSLGHQRKLTVDDLSRVGPYVEEAESSIIKSLEQQQSVRRLRRDSTITDTSALLAQVSDERVHDFSLDHPEGEDHKLVQQRHQDSSNNPQNGESGGQERRDEDKVPLIRRERAHRRDVTVEDMLAGLTNAMSFIHGHDSDSEDKGDDRSVHSGGTKQVHDYGGYTSAEAFAENAARLDRSNKMRKSQANSMWRMIKENLPTLREEVQKSTNEDTFPADTSGDGSDQAPSDIESQHHVTFEDDSSDDAAKKHNGAQGGKKKSRRKSTILTGAKDKFKDDFDAWRSFFRPRKADIWTYIRAVFFYVMVPLVGIAAALFYIGNNPIRGKSDDGSPGDRPSVSWWLLFCVRQVVTFSMALTMQGIMIDFLALGTRAMIRFMGPIMTLLIVQSKGWPFLFFWWCIFDFAMLFGTGAFAKHWCFWQNSIELFNDHNPSGHVVDSEIYTTILKVVVSVSVVVAVKRFVVGLYLGRQTFSHYGQSLAKVMNKMILVSEVAALAKSIEKAKVTEDTTPNIPAESGEELLDIAVATSTDVDDNTMNASSKMLSISDDHPEKTIQTELRDPMTGGLHASEKAKLMELLGQWEEPEKAYDSRYAEIATISAVLKFRKAITFIQKTYPFSYAFGPADTREACVDSSQKVYDRLLMGNPKLKVLQFETLALLALKVDGKTIDQRKAKDLVKLFRPDRQGNLTMIDFVKSVDSVYKEFRLLNASIANSGQIDRAFENLINVVFYSIVLTVTLSQLGFNPLALFLSLSSVILAFAFMIGSASAKYFEGLLFIIVRRPYNIGDRIHVSNVETDTSFDGAPGWMVEHVTLFETIAKWAPTNEKCSLSNGSLANSRIINWARSHQAQFHIFFKVPIETPYEKIVILKDAIQTYLKARPREWISLNGFRTNKVVTEKGYIEYMIVIMHREAWQNIGYILDSRSNFLSYLHEVTKQLNMHYQAPPLPVDLRHSKPLPLAEQEQREPEKYGEDMDQEEQMKEFRSQALKKYHIYC